MFNFNHIILSILTKAYKYYSMWFSIDLGAARRGEAGQRSRDKVKVK